MKGEKEEGSLPFLRILVKSYSQDIRRKRASSRVNIRVRRGLVRGCCSPTGRAAVAQHLQYSGVCHQARAGDGLVRWCSWQRRRAVTVLPVPSSAHGQCWRGAPEAWAGENGAQKTFSNCSSPCGFGPRTVEAGRRCEGLAGQGQSLRTGRSLTAP